jgi:hypothetical protein
MQATRTQRKQKRGRKSTSNNQKQVSQFAGDAYSLAERAYRGVNHVLKLINIETKYHDVAGTTLDISSTPAITYLSGTTQGLDITNRVADSLKLQGCELNYHIQILTTTVACTVRVVVVRDHNNSGATPAWLDVFETATNPALSSINYINKDRFSIVHDEALVIQPLAFPGVMKHLTFGNTGHVKYRSTTSAVASAAEGAIFLLYASTVANNFPVLNYFFRMKYTDD